MNSESIALLALCLTVLSCTGCSKEAASPVTPTTATSPPAANAGGAKAAAVSRKHMSACQIVTPAEMSAILGSAVNAAAGDNERPPAATECIYSSAAGSSAHAELEVDWGGGDPEVLGAAAGLATGAAPAGMVDPLQGLGDRAYQVTADQVFISSHGDLMMIRFLPKTSDVHQKARRIYEAAKSRM